MWRVWFYFFIIFTTVCYELEIDLDQETIWVSIDNQIISSNLVSLDMAQYHQQNDLFFKVERSLNENNIQFEEKNGKIDISLSHYNINTQLKKLNFHTSSILQKQILISAITEKGGVLEDENTFVLFNNYRASYYYVERAPPPDPCTIDLDVNEDTDLSINETCIDFSLQTSELMCDNYYNFNIDKITVTIMDSVITANTINFITCDGIEFIFKNCNFKAENDFSSYIHIGYYRGIPVRTTITDSIFMSYSITILTSKLTISNCDFFSYNNLEIDGEDIEFISSNVESSFTASIIGRGGVGISVDSGSLLFFNNVIYGDGILGMGNCVGFENYGEIKIRDSELIITGILERECEDLTVSNRIGVYIANQITILEGGEGFSSLEIYASFITSSGIDDGGNADDYPIIGVWLENLNINAEQLYYGYILVESTIPFRKTLIDYTTAIYLNFVDGLDVPNNYFTLNAVISEPDEVNGEFGRQRCFYMNEITNFEGFSFDCMMQCDNCLELIGFEIVYSMITSSSFDLISPSMRPSSIDNFFGFKIYDDNYFEDISIGGDIECDACDNVIGISTSFSIFESSNINLFYDTRMGSCTGIQFIENYFNSCEFQLNMECDTCSSLIAFDILSDNEFENESSFITFVDGSTITSLIGVQAQDSDFDDTNFFGELNCETCSDITGFHSFQNEFNYTSIEINIDSSVTTMCISTKLESTNLNDTDVNSYIECEMCNNVIGIEISSCDIALSELDSTILTDDTTECSSIFINGNGNVFSEITLSSNFDYIPDANTTGILITGDIFFYNLFILESGESESVTIPENAISINSTITSYGDSVLELYGYGIKRDILLHGVINTEGSIYLEGVNSGILISFINFRELVIMSNNLITVKYINSLQPKPSCYLEIFSSVEFENGLEFDESSCELYFDDQITSFGDFLINNADTVALQGNTYVDFNCFFNSIVRLLDDIEIVSYDANITFTKSIFVSSEGFPASLILYCTYDIFLAQVRIIVVFVIYFLLMKI